VPLFLLLSFAAAVTHTAHSEPWPLERTSASPKGRRVARRRR